MPLITETYYLSLTQDNRGILRLRCSQDDTLRIVNLKLYNNGSIFVIPSGVSASISGVKQNGAVFSKPCTISQDRESVVLQLSSDITNIDGIIVAEIVLNDGEGGRLGTSNFIIQVEKNPIRAGVVQDTETPIEYINDFIEKIQTLTARLNNLITPSGDASLAEVVDARIGILDNTTYQTLGARLNAEFQRLSNALSGITILESTGDTTDRTSEILSKLNAYGICKLGKGDFYVKNLVMPEDSMLVGSGNATRIVLLGSETNTYIVKPKSGCIIENISFDGGFAGTYSELIANSDARRHCIILDKFNDVNSENVILSNIFINNFVGSAIVQRYTTGCHCKDVIINMCYAGIDISNASYDGQCTNVYISNTKFGVIQNGSNFVFSCCISKDSVQHIMSDQQNTECTFSSCTFFDSNLETTSRLAILSNARNGFVFDNCIFDSSLSMLLVACDGIVIKGTNFVGSDTFAITVSNGRNTLLLITDCIADVEPVVTNAGTAARITSCYLKDGTAWSISEADIIVDDELSDESENPVQNKVINREISEIKADLDDVTESLGNLSNLETESKTDLVSAINEASQSGLSDAAKRALLNCFANIPWFGGEGSEYYNELESALYENLPIIHFVRGRGTSGASVVRNEKRAMSEFIPFVNEIPITIRLELKGNAFSFIGKFANTEYGFMLDTNIKTNDGNSSGFYDEDNHYGVFAFRNSDKQFTFEDGTSHNPKFMQSALSGETVGDHFCIVLADSDDQNNPLPETPISGFLEVQGRMYKIQEEDYQVIEVVKGKGISGQNIVDVANRALSDLIPFNNTAPITVQISLDGDAYLYNFKFTDTNNAIIPTDTVRTPNNIIGYFYDNTASVGGWGENRRPLTFKEYGTLEPSILGTSSDGQVPDGHFRLLFANANDSSGSLPEAPISGVVTVQGIKYKLTTSD